MEFVDRRNMSLEERVEIYKALGHKTRLQIFEKILTNNIPSEDKNIGMCITQIAAMYDYTLPTISKHLEILKHAGLITTHKVGKKIFVSVNIQKTQKICELFSNLIVNYQEKEALKV